MSAFLADARETVAPPRGAKDGLLPPLLVALTAVTGLVDAFSYLVLGHVFVANMTGNVVFLAFALAGVGGFSVLASLVAIGCFALGALVAGRVGRSLAGRRELLLAVTAAGQAVIVAEAVTMTALAASPVPTGVRYALIAVLAAAMGAQNATARKLAVPDLTTTVLTLTITGFAADGPLAGATGARVARRLISIAAMLVGAAGRRGVRAARPHRLSPGDRAGHPGRGRPHRNRAVPVPRNLRIRGLGVPCALRS